MLDNLYEPNGKFFVHLSIREYLVPHSDKLTQQLLRLTPLAPEDPTQKFLPVVER